MAALSPTPRSTCRAALWRCGALLGTLGLVACSDQRNEEVAERALSLEELRDPASCQGCHAPHYEQWAGSMHAYASDDPVFLAMNRLGQEQTGGELGDFCVRCHAPVAHRLGLTHDGLNLSELPAAVRGVTCYACHTVDGVERLHNNGLTVADDEVMRGGLRAPVANPAHPSAYSELHDSTEPRSAELCGACHDVVTPLGLPLERTYAEWHDSVFGPGRAPTPEAVLSCGACHLPPLRELPTQSGRAMHDHAMAGVDVALTRFPDTGDDEFDARVKREQRERVQGLLDTSLGVEICVQVLPGEQSAVYVTLENASAGHGWPSGAAQDRRAWVELVASREGSELYSSGEVAAGGDVTELAEPDLWLLRDTMLDARGEPVHELWRATQVSRATLPAALTTQANSPDFLANHVTARFPRDAEQRIAGVPDRVSVRVRFVPIGFDVLDRLLAEGGLDASVRDAMPTFELAPNRHLAQDAELGNLAHVTFEWSDATKADRRFATRMLTDEFFAKDCVAMSPRR